MYRIAGIFRVIERAVENGGIKDDKMTWKIFERVST